MHAARSIALQGRPRPAAADLGALFVRSVGQVALGAIVIALPVFLHLASPVLAIVACVLLALILANFAPPVVPAVLIVAYAFQNLFVAMVSPQIETLDALNAIRAYNFLLTAATWLVLASSYLLQRRSIEREMRRLMDVTTAAMVVIAVYFCVGLATDPTSAIVYLRNIATPFMLFQIFALVAYRYRVEIVGPLTVIAALALLYGYAEILDQEGLHRLVGGDAYLTIGMRQAYDSGFWLNEMHETGRVLRGYRDTMIMDFLNTPFLADWGFKLSRVMGPNFHAISFAYCVVSLAIVLAATGRWWFLVAAVPLALAIGSKGALALLAVATMVLLLITYVPASRRLWIYVLLLACYAGVGIVTGLNAGDYHVLGFVGGLRGFASNPFGHGLGSGGNLSMNMTVLDWSKSQGAGHTDVAVESAIGVLLFQVGVGGIVLLGVLAWIGARLWRLYRISLDPVFAAVGISVITITVNGIFQEEALFAPLALGLLASLAGLLLGSFSRESVRSASRAPQGSRYATARY